LAKKGEGKMKTKILSVLFTLLIAISLLLVSPPSVVKANGGPEAWDVDADVEPLLITINGSNASGQVFRVGQTLDIDGYINSIASISGSGECFYDAYIDYQFSLNRNIRLESYGTDWLSNSNYGSALIKYNDYNVSLSPYKLTDPGYYEITLQSYAKVDQCLDEESSPNFSKDDRATVTLSFKVVAADLITEGRHNPKDLGDLFVSYLYDSNHPEKGEYFNVEYVLDPTWEIVNTQVYIGTTPPTRSSPGKFPYHAGDIIGIDLGDYATTPVYIAAHAQIRKQTGVDKRGHPIYTHAGVWAQTGTDTLIDKGLGTYFQYTPLLP
jgi:hypothetical protein